MFKVLILFACITLIGIVGTMVFVIRQQDYVLYNELLASSRPDSGETALCYTQHKRAGVRKHIWYQDTSPLYFRIDSDDSELFFFHQDNQLEVIEQLGNVTCIMQEELYYEGAEPRQRIRYLEAERACYNYNSNLFIAEDVKLWKYQLPGHTPPQHVEQIDALMRATARRVEFTLKGEKLGFMAHQMRAVVNSQEKSL